MSLAGLSKNAGYYFFVAVFVLCFPLFVGCPDYSQQREVPDYSTMTDDAGSEEESQDE